MPDQAHSLRALVLESARKSRIVPEVDGTAIVAPRKAARMIAVTSGKGGVGKTNFCINLGILLAQTDRRVIVLDADLGLANLHVVLGISPRFHLEHVLRGARTLREIIYPTPCGVQIIAGGSGIADLANVTDDQRARFLDGLQELDDLADVILIDTGAGLSHNVLGFVLAVEEVIVVTTPEPTALTDAYATIKVITHENPGARVRVVVNMAASPEDAQVTAERLCLVARQFLNIELDVLGYIPLDSAVPRAVRAQRPVAIGSPSAPAARALEGIVAALGFDDAPVHPHGGSGARGFLNRVTRYFAERR